MSPKAQTYLKDRLVGSWVLLLVFAWAAWDIPHPYYWPTLMMYILFDGIGHQLARLNARHV